MDGPDRIVLLASDDHGTSWRYVATPLSNADAPPLGYQSFDGSALAEQDGRAYLLVTPNTASLDHDGTLVFEFDDLEAGTLVREAGIPVVTAHVPARPGLPADRRGGQADFHEANSAGGLLQPSLQVEDFPVFFQIFSTGRGLAPPQVPLSGGASLGLFTLLILATGIARHRRR